MNTLPIILAIDLGIGYRALEDLMHDLSAAFALSIYWRTVIANCTLLVSRWGTAVICRPDLISSTVRSTEQSIKLIDIELDLQHFVPYETVDMKSICSPVRKKNDEVVAWIFFW
jgi:hypothetical protein